MSWSARIFASAASVRNEPRAAGGMLRPCREKSKRPLLIALTGGIASGKSAVARSFAQLGVPVLDTDQIARDVVEPGTPALTQLVAEFGADILDAFRPPGSSPHA